LANASLATTEIREELKAFPYKAKEDGSCEKLLNGKCSVYKKRPTLCNVEKMHDKYYSDVPKEVYFNKNAIVCNKMMDDAGSKAKRVPWTR
tara:strand:+ start:1480 stop:1752 length:273 start_codon:yes stop_codon:yes gene_type:complete